MITEFGAEATRSGPVEQKGTYEFQRKFVMDHLAIHASKPFVNGSIHWALRDFRVHQTWQGGAPDEYATPPWHNKSLHRGEQPPQAGVPRRRESVPAHEAAPLACAAS